MVEHCTVRLETLGVTVVFTLQREKESWIDCVISLEYYPPLKVQNITSVPFYMARTDLQRLADYIGRQSRPEACDRYAFVPTNLGFELSMFDIDEMEATVQILLNVGTHEGASVYSGSRSQAQVSELHGFAGALRDAAKTVLPC